MTVRGSVFPGIFRTLVWLGVEKSQNNTALGEMAGQQMSLKIRFRYC